MPELAVGARRWHVAPGSNLLDALHGAGIAVPYSCRAGSCHACLVRCLVGEPDDAKPDALAADAREQGWRLACQCRVQGDLRVAAFDPAIDGAEATVLELAWAAGGVLRLRLRPARPLRYHAGQHLVLWLGQVARPYSLASLPGEDPDLEFHIQCHRPGAFASAAQQLQVGQAVGLGEPYGGALHYDPGWQGRPLWLLAAGTGLAPLYAVLREALRQQHNGPIRLLHVAPEHYLRAELDGLAQQWPMLALEYLETLPRTVRAPRQAIALACDGPASVEAFTRALFMAGVPRSQVYADTFSARC
ncbi:iron-sulfur-binding ferredoxin reductase [Pseudomonas typographi]|uniref:iron-sulfur-binding ferredoxin reductase n=1 Tax=Pseudomonas typographi TaxID=2715964 RepID=UPI001687D661|nr:iron-sulfur-binding ferredoxin reductase [Pseudomonas typographi]MBD1587714.1 iron-sulfur-binding ferredoxin reductase [Pseudomonas typographi]